ncbi:MAG: S-layer homology domain-containing protein [Oscillibacter sp.]|nr:S-layer homology domain-containing protein [Oscillibacter sp.]
MKKFLSLVLALVMTMSLVTISAGATEYKDFTDKSEIQYAEAVTVLNKLGIITGYSEGDFRPQGELTRGAAAKIIVSLLIGPDAAAALGNETSPYPDVPAGNNFAGVISFCKTSEIISGYGDGTFRPQGTLTGYAFAKMLLGALGYSSDYEGFTGPGWNMKVAKLGGEAGLFDRISFNGNATVTREQACQLALNTLKGTMVEYSGGMNISAGEAHIVANPTRDYKTSNQEFAQHINNRKAGNQQASDETWYTVEFGEEHFVDLRMEREQSNADSFGRPANVWSWKKVTIGTFPIEADYVFDHQLTHKDATDAAKNRATGLGGFKLTNTNTSVLSQTATRVWVNGKTDYVNNSSDLVPALGKVAEIADLTDNGTIVEVYVSDLVADFITDIVVLKTQLMEVRRVGSDYVAIQKEDNKDVDKMVAGAEAFNQTPIDVTVENVLAEDDLYSVVSGLKAGDLVAVIPVAQDETGATKWDVGDVYVPETVTGALTAVNTYGKSGQGAGSKQGAVDVTVGGTKYNVALWSRDMYDIDPDAVKVTRKDVTLVLDRNGNALKAKDVGDTSDWFIVGNYYSTMVNGKIVTMVDGWDVSGNKMTLNLGTAFNSSSTQYRPGDLVRYGNSTKNGADWALDDGQVKNVNSKGNRYEIKSSDVFIPLVGMTPDLYTAKDIKFIYVNFDEESGDVDSIEIKTGVQGVKPDEIDAFYSKGAATPDTRYNPAQAGYSYKSGTTTPDVIKVVVIKEESNDAMASNMMYIRAQIGGGVKDENGDMIYHYTAAKLTADGLEEMVDVYTDDQVRVDTFVAYTEREHKDYSNFYDLRNHNNFTTRTTSTFQAQLGSVIDGNNGLIRLAPASVNYVLGTQGTTAASWNGSPTPNVFGDPRNNIAPDTEGQNGGESRNVRIRNAVFVDLRTTTTINSTREINSLDDFNWVFEHYLDKTNTGNNKGYLGSGDDTLVMQMIINDNETSNSFRDVAMIVITNQIEIQPANYDGKVLSSNKDLTVNVAKALTADNGNHALTSTSNSLTVTAPAGGLGSLELKFSCSGTAAMKVTGGSAQINGAAIATDSENRTNPFTLTGITGVGTIIVTVTAEDNTTQTYTITVAEDNGLYVNERANEIGEGATDFTPANYNQADDAHPIVSISGGVLTAPVLDNGVEADVKAQLQSALDWLAEKNGKTYTQLTNRGGGVWAFMEDGFSSSWTAPANIDTLVKIDDGTNVTAKVVAAGTKIGGSTPNLNLSGHVLVTPLTGDPYFVEGGSGDGKTENTAVVAGATYKADAGAKVTLTPWAAGTDDAAIAAFEATYSVESGIVAKGSTVTVTLKAKNAITNPENSVTAAATIAFGTGATNLKKSGDTVTGAVDTGVATTWKFGNTKGATIIAKDDTLSATYTISRDVTLDKVVYTAATGT